MTRQPITTEQWEKARATWEADDQVTYGEIGDSLGVSKQAVAKRAKAENWQRRANREQIMRAAHKEADRRISEKGLPKATFSASPGKEAAQVDAAISRNTAVVERMVAEEVDSDGLTPAERAAKEADALAAARRAEVLTRHRNEINAVRNITYEAMQKKDLNLSKVGKVNAEALQIIHNIERRAWGMDTADAQPPVIVFERG